MSNPLSALIAAGKAFAGYGDLTLGPVKFTSLELPASIPIGGTQAIAVHDLPGGQRIVDTLGTFENAIGWRGVLFGQAQSTRARLLDRLRQSGQPISLVWGDYSYTVIVTQFRCDTKIIGPMPYSIGCLVVANDTAPQGTTLLSLADQVATDLVDGNPVGALSAVSQGVAVPIGAAQAATAAPGAMSAGTQVYSTAVSAVNSAAAAINSAQATADKFVQSAAAPIANALGVSPSGITVGSLASGITAIAQATGDSANLTRAAGYFGRVLTNLKNASA